MAKYKLLNTLYRDVSKPSGLSGERKLYRLAKSIDDEVTLKDVKTFLAGKDSYTLHKITPKRFKRRKMIAPAPKVIISCDLADMQSLARYNFGFRYILFCIDIFSRYVKALPIKKKSSPFMLKAMKNILESAEFQGVSRIHVDRGSEFYNKTLKVYLESKNITLYSVSSYEIKAALSERVIQTLKRKIFKYLTDNNTLKYINVLQQLVDGYNLSEHRGLGKGLSPTDVHVLKNPKLITEQFRRMYKEAMQPKVLPSPSLDIGQSVRIVDNQRRSRFRRGFTVQNTLEIFKIRFINRTQTPTTYYLSDLNGENIEGVFYFEELIPTSIPDVFPIEILKQKKVKGRRKYFVHWKGYPDSVNSWVDEKEVKRLHPDQATSYAK